jgi:hypothetical protein
MQIRILKALNKCIKDAGTQVAAAKRLGISPAYLNDLINGRRSPGEKVLAGLNLKKIVTYEETDAETDT